MGTTAHLIDASPYIFRAYFSLPSSMRDVDGKPAQASYGFASFLAQYLTREAPEQVGVYFDGSLTTSFRNEIYPEYKAGRELPPEELEAQLDDCQALAQAFGLHTWIDDRYEADDGIGARVAHLRASGQGCVMVTPDKDMAQLVDEHVQMYDFAKDRRYGPAEVHERWGVRPDQVRDLLGLAGDAVDGIPGVRGVGPKTATALLAAYPDMEAIYANLGAIAELDFRGAKTLGKKLEAAREIAFLSRELATIAVEAPCAGDAAVLNWLGADEGLVDGLFKRLDFTRLKGRIPRWCPTS